jgi:hypothetical protein
VISRRESASGALNRAEELVEPQELFHE